MRILVVDDEPIRHETLMRRYPTDEMFHAYTYKEAAWLVGEVTFDIAWLDYDLKDPAGTGMSVVQLMIKLPAERRPKNVFCHSLNCYRRTVMAKLLMNNGIDAMPHEFEYSN